MREIALPHIVIFFCNNEIEYRLIHDRQCIICNCCSCFKRERKFLVIYTVSVRRFCFLYIIGVLLFCIGIINRQPGKGCFSSGICLHSIGCAAVSYFNNRTIAVFAVDLQCRAGKRRGSSVCLHALLGYRNSTVRSVIGNRNSCRYTFVSVPSLLFTASASLYSSK